LSTQLENLLREAVDTTRPYVAPRKNHPNELIHRFLYERLLPGLLAVNPAVRGLPTNPLAAFHKVGFPAQWNVGEEGYFDVLATLKREADALFVIRLQEYQSALKEWSKKNLEILVEQSKKESSAKRILTLEEELVPLTILKDDAKLAFLFARALEETVRVIPSAYGSRDNTGEFHSELSVQNTVDAIKWVLRVTQWIPKDHENRFVINWHGEFSKLTDEIFGN